MTKNVNSLFTLTVYYAAENIANWRHNNYENLAHLPPAVKERIMDIITRCSMSHCERELPKILGALAHPTVERIDLSHFNLTDVLLAAVSVCTKAKKVYFNGCGAVELTSPGLINFLSGKNNLKVLMINACQMVTDEVLKCIELNCPQLTYLDVGECRDITDEGLCALSTLENIKCLRISNTQITHRGISKFVTGPSGKKINELRINDCRYITESALQCIIDNCVLLETVIFYNCAISKDDVDLVFKGNNSKNLKQLTWTVTL